MIKYLLILNLFVIYSSVYGGLAGGRLNAFSGGENAFAGVVNPANAVWIADRLDVGVFCVHQKLKMNNYDDNPFFSAGKISFTHRCKNLCTADVAIHKRVNWEIGPNILDSSISLAAYTQPSFIKLRTKQPIPLSGTTPVVLFDKTRVISTVFSLKFNTYHSFGFSIDYLSFSHRRGGFQNSDNLERSVSPGAVTNNGMDHSHGIGFSIGWRWNVTENLNFGAAWSKKSYCGQYRKYRGFEPHHAENYTPQIIGAGIGYRFMPKLAGRFEVLWMNLGNLPNSNSNILSDGSLNLNKRGSDKSPGAGLQDATYINIGMGYQCNLQLSIGAGFSHRIKLAKNNSNILSHTYTFQTIYDTLSLGANFNYRNHNLFFGFSYGFKNKVSGFMPKEVGGGRFATEKQNTSLSISWGYIPSALK